MKKIVHQFLEKEYLETQKVHQLRQLFERYKTVNKSLVAEYQQEYSASQELIVSALYSSDYIITSSEIRFDLEDSGRRKEIIEFWQSLSISEEKDWRELTHLVAFTYSIASLLRKRYYFQLDKGIKKEIAAEQVADFFLRHLLEFCVQKFPDIPFGWFAFLSETALCRSVFSEIIARRSETIQNIPSDERGLISHLIMNHLVTELEKETNKSVPVPYIKETSIFYLFTCEEGGKRNEYTSSNMKTGVEKTILKEFRKCTPWMDSNYPHILKYIRTNCKYSNQSPPYNHFIVHAKSGSAEGWISLLSPVDDINLSMVESLLQMKLEDIKSFNNLKNKLPPVNYTKEKEVEREEIVEIIQKEEKKGFFSKFFSRFRKKKDTLEEAKTEEKKPFDTWKKLIMEELLVASVGGINLGIDFYDDYRENQFIISGVVESEIKEINPTIFYSEKIVSFPSDLLDPIILLVSLSRNWTNLVTNQETIYTIPEEAFYLESANIEALRLAEFVAGDDVLIGILSDKYEKNILVVAKDEPIYKRQQIQKKVRELLSALQSRKNFSIVDAGKRTLSKEINWDNVNTSYEKKPLFFADKNIRK